MVIFNLFCPFSIFSFIKCLDEIFILKKNVECLIGFVKLQPLKSAQGTYCVATVDYINQCIFCILTETIGKKYQLSEDLVNQLPHGSDPPS